MKTAKTAMGWSPVREDADHAFALDQDHVADVPLAHLAACVVHGGRRRHHDDVLGHDFTDRLGHGPRLQSCLQARLLPATRASYAEGAHDRTERAPSVHSLLIGSSAALASSMIDSS